MVKTILVTGATDGIGKMTALRLVQQGHSVIVHGRDEKRVNSTIAEIKNQAGKSSTHIEGVVFDLSSLASVKSGALELKSRYSVLDVLLNNAGTYQLERHLSKDGVELTMAINHLGPTLLTLLLKPELQSSPNPRVIFVSSIAHNRGNLESLDFNFEKSFNAYGAYATSKLANIITTRQLAREWKSDGINIYSLHPGVISTKLLRLGFNREGDSVQKGSDTSVYLASEKLDSKFNGEYFVDSRVADVCPQAKNDHLGETFWQWTIKQLAPFLKS